MLIFLLGSGHGDTNVSTTTFQTETPTSVLMSGGLTMNDRSVTPEGGVSMQGTWFSEVSCKKFSFHLNLCYYLVKFGTIKIFTIDAF